MSSLNPAFRVAEGNKYPKIAPDFGPDTRRFEGGMSGIFTLRSNAVAGPKDKQDGIILFFRDPYSPEVKNVGPDADAIEFIFSGTGGVHALYIK